jgi:threonine dehydrogenase-like Zn-dependent dehydrogenase
VVGGGPLGNLLAAISRARGAPLLEPPALAGDHRPRRIFETSGTASGRAQSLALANPGATITFLASSGADDQALRVSAAFAYGATIHGVVAAHPDLFPEVAALAVRGDLVLDQTIELIGRSDIVSLRQHVQRAHASEKTLLVTQP